jgi:hypothetical protein
MVKVLRLVAISNSYEVTGPICSSRSPYWLSLVYWQLSMSGVADATIEMTNELLAIN